MTLDGFGNVYCLSGDARWSAGPPHYSFQHPSSWKRLVPACLWRGRFGGYPCQAGERSLIITVPNSEFSRCARPVLRWLILGGCPATTQAI